jgi:calcineurin-like phosphoesterase family protein
LRQWPKAHQGAWHLHGHSHGTLVPWGLTFDVGVDGTNGYLYDLDSIVAHFKEREEELRRCRK